MTFLTSIWLIDTQSKSRCCNNQGYFISRPVHQDSLVASFACAFSSICSRLDISMLPERCSKVNSRLLAINMYDSWGIANFCCYLLSTCCLEKMPKAKSTASKKNSTGVWPLWWDRLLYLSGLSSVRGLPTLYAQILSGYNQESLSWAVFEVYTFCLSGLYSAQSEGNYSTAPKWSGGP